MYLDPFFLIYSCISTKSYIIVIELVAYTLMFIQEEGVLKGQELENAVSDADYTKAIQIAFELRRPHKHFELFAELCRLGTCFFFFFPFLSMVSRFLIWVLCRKREADAHIHKALVALGTEEFHLLFEYVREWNTKPKLCHIAQSVLFGVLNILPPTEIIEVVVLLSIPVLAL